VKNFNFNFNFVLTVLTGDDDVMLKFYAKDVNGTLTTLETRDPLMMRVIGQRQELSFYDVKLANKAYCNSRFHSFTNYT